MRHYIRCGRGTKISCKCVIIMNFLLGFKSKSFTIYKGLEARNRYMVDVVMVEGLINKTYEATYELLEELASNNYQWSFDRSIPGKAARVINDTIGNQCWTTR